jgi:hypothetical protein
MITRDPRISAAVLVAVASLTCGTQRVHAAFGMRTYIQSISQSGFSASVSVGHTVMANSDMNRLYAAGAFEARCVSSYTGSITDQRGLSAQSLLGGTSLTVTVPEWLPAVRTMPGFDQVPGGTTLACTYNWTADAEESTFSAGVPGFGMTIGGLKAHDGHSVPFEMYQPGGNGERGTGCIH